MMSLSNPNPDLVETKLSIRGEHGSGLDRTASGLTPILAGSGLDQTAFFLKIGGQDWIC